MMIKIVCALGILLAVNAITDKNSKLVIKNISSFPWHMDEQFQIIIGPKNKMDILSNSLADTLVLHITDAVGLENEIAVIDFGFKEMIDREFSGEFIKIPTWERSLTKNQLNVSVIFTKFANQQILEIYHIDAFTSKERREMLKDLKLARLLYRSNISLFIPSKLEFTVKGVKVKKLYEVKDGENLNIMCSSFDGVPEMRPAFVNVSNPKIKFWSIDPSQMNLNFTVTKADHNKNITCQAGKSKQVITLKVFHPPTNITINGVVNGTVANGSALTCLVQDGYPKPKLSWEVILGPSKDSNMYWICPYSKKLFIRPNATVGTAWTVECVARSNFSNTVLKKSNSFSIAHKRKTLIDKIGWNWDKNTSKNMHHTIVRQGKEIQRLSIKIDKLNKEILNFKSTGLTQKFEIANLKKSLKGLKNKIDDESDRITNLKKFVDQELSKNQRNVVERISTMSPAPTKPAVVLVWKVEDVSRLIRKRKTIRSQKFYKKNSQFPMILAVSFVELGYIRATLHMFKMYSADYNLVIKGQANMTIFNAEDKRYSYSLVKSFQRGRPSNNVGFLFPIADLFQKQVLESNEILVQCTVSLET